MHTVQQEVQGPDLEGDEPPENEAVQEARVDEPPVGEQPPVGADIPEGGDGTAGDAIEAGDRLGGEERPQLIGRGIYEEEDETLLAEITSNLSVLFLLEGMTEKKIITKSTKNGETYYSLPEIDKKAKHEGSQSK